MNKANKYLPFDALEGYKDYIKMATKDNNKVEKPILSDDEKNYLDLFIMDCFSLSRYIEVSYYENGFINQYRGTIKKIDFVESLLILSDNVKLSFSNIVSAK